MKACGYLPFFLDVPAEEWLMKACGCLPFCLDVPAEEWLMKACGYLPFCLDVRGMVDESLWISSFLSRCTCRGMVDVDIFLSV